jgi:hypothetical protein
VKIELKEITHSAAEDTDKARKEAALKKKRFPTELLAVFAFGMFLETLPLPATRPPVCMRMMNWSESLSVRTLPVTFDNC